MAKDSLEYCLKCAGFTPHVDSNCLVCAADLPAIPLSEINWTESVPAQQAAKLKKQAA